jgi:DNA-binding LytR/AlgR family response regulator
LRTIITDDEPAARTRLRRLLNAHPQVEVVAEAEDGLEALQQIEALRPELLFLDIQMPGLNGFGVLRALPGDMEAPLVIFVTGLDQHALAAFEAHALDYLLKPVDADRLSLAIDRAIRIRSSAPDRNRETERQLRAAGREVARALRQIVGRKGDRFVLLRPEDIVLFQLDDGIVRARRTQDSYWVNYQLGELEAALVESAFFRAHRSSLVNLAHVKEIRPFFKSSFLLVMDDPQETQIQVSERQSKELRRRIPGL